jgi:O-methyltransferase
MGFKQAVWARAWQGWYALWNGVEHGLFRGREYGLAVPFGYRVFTPWFETGTGGHFSRRYGRAERSGSLHISADRGYLLDALTYHALFLPGDIAECGVYRGGSAMLLAQALAEHPAAHGKRLHLFDTFSGMPDSAVPSRDYFKPGAFGDTSVAQVLARLGELRDQCVVHAGLFATTLPGLPAHERFCFVHLDADIYPSVHEACVFLWPRITVGGMLVCDDYGFRHLRSAARAAMDDYFATVPEKPIALPTGQALVYKVCST